MLTSHSVQCCSSLKSLSSRSSCWCQVEQPVLLTHVCLSLEWGAWCCGNEDEDAGELHQNTGPVPKVPGSGAEILGMALDLGCSGVSPVSCWAAGEG